jgi:hypothetical protein
MVGYEMTSGVYTRSPDSKPGRKPTLTTDQVTAIRIKRGEKFSITYLSSLYGVSEKSITRVLNKQDAYRESK